MCGHCARQAVDVHAAASHLQQHACGRARSRAHVVGVRLQRWLFRISHCGFAALLLCHATTYAAPALATTPMDGAEFSAAEASARQASEADFHNMRGNTFLLTNGNNFANDQNKAAAIKTDGAEAVYGAAQMLPDVRA